MLNLTINQENLYLILPSKISWMADMLVTDEGISLQEALTILYSSDLYRRLEDESTKLWHWGPVALYEELMEERAEKC